MIRKKTTNKIFIVCIAVVVSIALIIPTQLIGPGNASAASDKIPIKGNVTFQFDDVGQEMGWNDGDVLSSTYTISPTQSDPSIPGEKSIQLIGNENMEYVQIDGQMAIGYKANTKQDGGFFKIPTIEGYDITEVSYNLRAYNTRRTMPDVACVCATAPYYDEEHTEWWDWKIPDSVSWWLTEFDPDYRYVPKNSDFYISAWRVKDQERLAISAIGVTYTKSVPKCAVSGQVVDKNGAPVEDVTISSIRPNYITKTNSDGKWTITTPALNDTAFVFTKKGYYESAIHVDLENYSEYTFDQPYILIAGTNCIIETNDDLRHKNFEIESWVDEQKIETLETHHFIIKAADEATVTCEADGRLHYDYTDINTSRHKENYLKAMPKDGFYFIGWELENTNGQMLEPGEVVTINTDTGDYKFVPVYSDTPPTPPAPDNPQAEEINNAQTGDGAALAFLVFITLLATANFIYHSRRKEHLF